MNVIPTLPGAQFWHAVLSAFASSPGSHESHGVTGSLSLSIFPCGQVWQVTVDGDDASNSAKVPSVHTARATSFHSSNATNAAASNAALPSGSCKIRVPCKFAYRQRTVTI